MGAIAFTRGSNMGRVMKARLLSLIDIPLALVVLIMTPAFAADVASMPTGTTLTAGMFDGADALW
jgi:hypothetical protein